MDDIVVVSVCIVIAEADGYRAATADLCNFILGALDIPLFSSVAFPSSFDTSLVPPSSLSTCTLPLCRMYGP